MIPATASKAALQFERDGYLVMDRVFSETEIAPVSDEIDRLIEGKSAYVPERDLVWEPDTDPPRLRNAFRLHLYHDFFLNFAGSPKITGILGELLGHPLRLYGSQLFAKPARVGTRVPKHQDMPYWPFDPPELITAWIALDDTSVENGCVRFFAGSHKLGMLPHAPSNVKGNSLGLVDHPGVDALPEHAVEVKRGSVVLHHALTVHRSEPNRSNHSRRGLVYVYMSPDVKLTQPERMQGPAVFPEVG
ncbi:MAG TPA: phytanoyl-CoA dioxygenase family protein [Bryobacteraceae bacterium]|jgi:phytanoyl-CoA hydroxylase|nr:phytanoyl-CoA dioxygenase family protein [Bryobacteraceae bacterium]